MNYNQIIKLKIEKIFYKYINRLRIKLLLKKIKLKYKKQQKIFKVLVKIC